MAYNCQRGLPPDNCVVSLICSPATCFREFFGSVLVSHTNSSPSVVYRQGIATVWELRGRGWDEGVGGSVGATGQWMDEKWLCPHKAHLYCPNVFGACTPLKSCNENGDAGSGEKRTCKQPEREREREYQGFCFLSQAMTWLIVFFWSNFGTWKTAHLSWRKMMCRTAQMEISSNEKD